MSKTKTTAQGVKHTAGPWKAQRLDKRVLIEAGRGQKRLDVEVSTDDRDTATAEANARLITAAPNMFAAIEEALAWMDHANAIVEPEDRVVRERLVAAIARATGGVT